ncbi:NAD-dependent histone deacetylase HST3 [Colletotrichum chlorophyti]|uniref:NAD-dependent histone deacetylase HST3 n=1 Tax=Colletotrichum chlorophyti TaxID=708187 RepID=A0A1Q8RTD8_9PEZI|nr:NAD-dependent histone deacetylase HST3 [Colletotrichum chlorophyti]
MPTTQVTPSEDLLLQGIADALFKARKVVVITGAGISTNSGIPDFRSENGLYSLIQAQFDAAARQDATAPGCHASTGISQEEEQEPPAKRRRLSFQDSAIYLPSEDSQISEDSAVSGFNDDKFHFSKKPASQDRSSDATAFTGPITRARSRESSVEDRMQTDTTSKKAPAPVRRKCSTRSSRQTSRARSLPPDESPQKFSEDTSQVNVTETRHESMQHDTPNSFLRRRGRSSSPDTRRRPNAYQAQSAALRKRSLLTASLSSTQLAEIKEGSRFASSPLNSGQGRSKLDSHVEEPDSVPVHPGASHVTPKSSRFCFSSSPLSSPPSGLPQTPTFRKDTEWYSQSNLVRQSLGFSSSPLSSPPPVLFDPFEERSSSLSRQTSSTASSAASSDTDEAPSFCQPSKSTLPNIKGRDLFDASIWADPTRTSVFYTFATTLRQKVKDVEPTESHHFIGHLRNRGKLVRCYTQNIDQIEEKVGLSTSLQEGPGHRGRFSRKSIGATLATTASSNSPASGESSSSGPEHGEQAKELGDSEKVCSTESRPQQSDRKSNGVECVFLHGSLESLRCFLCGRICPWDEDGRAHETLSGRQPECPFCAGATAARQERGKRALGVGKLRPDIVLYGEEHPNAHLISPIVTHDLGLSPDLLLILGTSLKVHGLKILVREFAKTIHSRGGKVVFVNFTKPPESSWGDIIDYWVQWDCDAWVSNLKDRIPLLWLPPGTKLPKKKRENSEKAKKRQSTAEEKPNVDASKLKSDLAKTEVLRDVERPDATEENSDASNSMCSNVQSQVQEEATTTSQPASCPKRTDGAVEAKLKPKEAKKQKPKPQKAACLNLQEIAPSRLTGVTPVEESRRDVSLEPQEHTYLKLEQNASTQPGDTPTLRLRDVTTTKPPPQRPMAVRDDRTNAAWVTWKVITDLHRITGSNPTALLQPSTVALRESKLKPKPKRPRQSAPAALSHLPEPMATANSSQLSSSMPGINQHEQTPVLVPNGGSETKDTVMVGTEESAGMVVAVKLNPRKRRPKTLFGGEVVRPATSRTTKDALKPNPQRVKTSQTKTQAMASPVSPKILSDIERISMDSLTLPPITNQSSDGFQSPKPQPLEPAHSPIGPLSAMSPNTLTRIDPLMENPFRITDNLLKQLWEAPNWSRPSNCSEKVKRKGQSTKGTDAAMALRGIKK